MFWLVAVVACSVVSVDLAQEGVEIAEAIFWLSLLFIFGLWLNERGPARRTR